MWNSSHKTSLTNINWKMFSGIIQNLSKFNEKGQTLVSKISRMHLLISESDSRNTENCTQAIHNKQTIIEFRAIASIMGPIHTMQNQAHSLI